MAFTIIKSSDCTDRKASANLPEDFVKGRPIIKIKSGMVKTMESIAIKTVRAYDKENKPIVSKITGQPVFNEIAYLAFTDGTIGVTKSASILNQIAQFPIGYTPRNEETIDVYDGGMTEVEFVMEDRKFGSQVFPVLAFKA